MLKVKIEDPETKQKNPVSFRWIHATESYDRTLHSRILATGDEKGASCLDCHIHRGEGFNGHDILKDEHKLASTHPDQLDKTCGASGCHDYAKNPLNNGFIKTDVHDLNQVHLPDFNALLAKSKWGSAWSWGAVAALIGIVILALGSLGWLLIVYPKNKKNTEALVGAERFEQVMLGRKAKAAPAKAAPAKVPAKPIAEAKNVDSAPPIASEVTPPIAAVDEQAAVASVKPEADNAKPTGDANG